MSVAAVLSAQELPWLQQPMARVRAALAGERAPHSLLVTGQPGAGLKLFADWLITLRRCSDAAHAPCGSLLKNKSASSFKPISVDAAHAPILHIAT